MRLVKINSNTIDRVAASSSKCYGAIKTWPTLKAITEEILKDYPDMCSFMAPSLDARQDIVVVEVPKPSKQATSKAIEEWDQHKSMIINLVFCTTSGVDMPGADYQLTKLLGLRPPVKHLMMYQQGCFPGGTDLRLAKDLTENNAGAHVFVVYSEITVVTCRGLSESHLDSLVGEALFGDCATTNIIGVDPDIYVEPYLGQSDNSSRHRWSH